MNRKKINPTLQSLLLRLAEDCIKYSDGDKDLKFYGQTMFRIAKLGEDFDPETFDLHSDPEKVRRTLLDRCVQVAHKVKLNDAQKGLLKVVQHDLIDWMIEHEEKMTTTEFAMCNFFITSTVFLQHEHTQTFSILAGRLFQVWFFSADEVIASGVYQ